MILICSKMELDCNLISSIFFFLSLPIHLNDLLWNCIMPALISFPTTALSPSLCRVACEREISITSMFWPVPVCPLRKERGLCAAVKPIKVHTVYYSRMGPSLDNMAPHQTIRLSSDSALCLLKQCGSATRRSVQCGSL